MIYPSFIDCSAMYVAIVPEGIHRLEIGDRGKWFVSSLAQ